MAVLAAILVSASMALIAVGLAAPASADPVPNVQQFFAAVQAAGVPAELIVGEAYNHFELLETLANPYGLMGCALLRQMNLA